MDLCTNCGEKVNESSKFCPNCGSRVVAVDQKNMTSTQETRIDIKKNRSKKKLLVVVGSLIGLLIVISVTLIVKDFSKPEPKSNVTVTKTIDQSKDKVVENKDQASPDHNSTEENSHDISSSDYFLPASDKSVMSEEDVANLTKGQLRLARNEIYARHGYVFKSEDLQTYFSSKSWYQPDQSFDGSLNEIEKENVNFIKAREDSL
ncbi:YARHG domain-containing protein [Neobacillus sp. SuZ13]|uniref:YARHG domain-containing protein n=1 Tax=Neobacillus sp. SuZ13 TaxID=3047875 RepID=UPI0024BFF690|nr:YARHG domain-containing protein [Neobacillus sp. SuZ13]WHY66641.1 YARHG domain-containing protein [Neobacillus sp. SuZ13]